MYSIYIVCLRSTFLWSQLKQRPVRRSHDTHFVSVLVHCVRACVCLLSDLITVVVRLPPHCAPALSYFSAPSRADILSRRTTPFRRSSSAIRVAIKHATLQTVTRSCPLLPSNSARNKTTHPHTHIHTRTWRIFALAPLNIDLIFFSSSVDKYLLSYIPYRDTECMCVCVFITKHTHTYIYLYSIVGRDMKPSSQTICRPSLCTQRS